MEKCKPAFEIFIDSRLSPNPRTDIDPSKMLRSSKGPDLSKKANSLSAEAASQLLEILDSVTSNKSVYRSKVCREVKSLITIKRT